MKALGFSSLGLPLLGEDARPVDVVLDAVFGGGRFDLLELHLSEPLPLDGRRLIPDEMRRRLQAIAAGAARRGGRVAFGVGGRFVLGPRKHEPALSSPEAEGRALRIRLLSEALDVASELEAQLLVFLGGPSSEALAPPAAKHASDEWKRFEDGIGVLAAYAETRGVVLAPEAHSRHIFATVADARRLKATFPAKAVGLTADVVHLSLTEREPLGTVLSEIASLATHVQLDNLTPESRRPGADIVHRLLDEDGAVDTKAAIAALARGDYAGALSVEFLRTDAPHVDPLDYCRRIGAWLRSITG